MTKKSDQDSWDPCSPGSLHEAAKQSVGSPWQLVLTRGAILLAVTTLVFAALIFSGEGSSSGRLSELPPKISCQDVKLNLVGYIHGKLDSSELTNSVSFHLIECKCCNDEYKRLCRCKESCGDRPTKATLKPSKPCDSPAPTPVPTP